MRSYSAARVTGSCSPQAFRLLASKTKATSSGTRAKPSTAGSLIRFARRANTGSGSLQAAIAAAASPMVKGCSSTSTESGNGVPR